MTQIINNTLFEKKHHYMFIMKEIQILREQMETEALNDEISRSRLDEIRSIWNLVFVGLLREGLSYQYIKNANNPKKDMIRLTIDNINYDCYQVIVEAALKEEYEEVMKIKNISSDKTSDKNKNKLEKLKEKNVNTIDESIVKNPIPLTPINNAEISSRFIEDDYVSESMLVADSQKVADYPTPHEESIKYSDTWVYDKHQIEVMRPGASSGDKFIVFVAPYKISRDDNAPEIMVMIANKKKEIETFYSDKTASVIVNFDNHEFIVRGSFVNYEFSSHILTYGMTNSMNCVINDDVEEFRCKDPERVNYGHICYTMNDENNNKIATLHVLPINQQNNKYGVADVGMFAEDINGEKTSIISYHKKGAGIPIGDKIYSVVNFWQDTCLSSEVLKNAN